MLWGCNEDVQLMPKAKDTFGLTATIVAQMLVVDTEPQTSHTAATHKSHN